MLGGPRTVRVLGGLPYLFMSARTISKTISRTDWLVDLPPPGQFGPWQGGVPVSPARTGTERIVIRSKRAKGFRIGSPPSG